MTHRKSQPLAAYPAAWTICPMRFLLAFAQGGLLSPLLPLLHETFDVSHGELGLLTAMPGLSSVVMDVIATYLLSRRPLLTLLLQGIVLTAIGLLGSALAPGFYWLVGAQMLLGLGSSMTRVASLTVVVAATPPSAMGRANSLLEFSGIAGFVLSPTLSGVLASLLHWRFAFGLSTVFVVAAGAWVLLTRQALGEAAQISLTTPDPEARAPSQPVWAAADRSRQRQQAWAVRVAYLAAFMLSFMWAGFVALALPLYAGEVVGISTSTLGVVLTAGLLVDLVLLLPTGWLADRLDYRLVLVPAMLLMAGALVWLPAVNSLAALFAVSVCLHMGFAAWGMPSAALALLVPEKRLARTMGIYRLLVDGAVVVAPWLIGVCIGQYGYGLPAWLTAAAMLLTASLVAHGMQTSRRGPGREWVRSVTPPPGPAATP